MSDDFSFGRFVERTKVGAFGRDEGARYAYSADILMLRSFSRMKPVEYAAAALVRTSKEMLRGQLLGQGVKVGPKQFGRLFSIAEHCAKTLQVPTPQLYVVNSPVVNAYTFGTDAESFIVLHSSLVDHLTDKELEFVIGHETGHIQNKHVVYGTALQVLTRSAEAVIGIFVEPALVALRTWYRRAEITCDRAGLLCAQDLDAGVSSFMKLAIGSARLFSEMDVETYLEQLEENRGSVGRYLEAFASHPYLPKRITALRVFAESRLYREAIGQEGGIDIEDVDARTSQIIRIDGTGGGKASAPPASEGDGT
jgi:Zn-dependent protease with chaperone function